ncbi:hypothetical protein GLS40_05875 [Pseudooceanicola sp. 216_PA32_1]|uniref:Uncharacterized protein n=1 Tax=Pseudooceanicola pacificus TaxID=2676438 RepID=A0A844W4B0_9RHOB|nr:hypothetical protein [Pseudooceanicola pacificus]MWB77544.1 hypothetical protein [Pseudooceanicola pacificus]
MAGLRAGLICAALASACGAAKAGTWPTTDWQGVCISGEICDLTDPGALAVLEQLREGSARLDALGFNPPHLLRSSQVRADAPYVVLLQAGDFPVTDASGRAGQLGGYYQYDQSLLAIAYDNFFAMNTETSGYMDAPVHELFHAVQGGYDGYLWLKATSDGGNWVLEGTATAVQAVLPDAGQSPGGGYPLFDAPLDRLHSSTGRRGTYMSYPFWTYIAATRGGGLPGGLGVLHDFFTAIGEVEADRATPDPSTLAIVDRAMRHAWKQPLAEVYTDFIAGYAFRETNYKGLSDPAGWKALDEAGPTSLVLTGRLEPMAAQAWALTVRAGEDTDLEIRLESPDPALRLVVDRARVDRPDGAGSGERNLFYRARVGKGAPPGGTTFIVRVLNAPDAPAEYKPRDFTLTAHLRHEYARYGQSVGTAQIDAPVTLEMDRHSAYLLPNRTEITLAAGFENACSLRLGLRNFATGDSAGLEMDHEGPIGPGSYPLATVGGGRGFKPETFPGMGVSGFVLGRRNPLARGFEQTFDAQGGALEITTISAHWIEGTLRIAGKRRSDGEWTNDGYVAFPAELARLEARIAFGLRIGRSFRQDRFIPVTDCLTPLPVRLRREPIPIPVPRPKPDPEPDPVPKVRTPPPTDKPGEVLMQDAPSATSGTTATARDPATASPAPSSGRGGRLPGDPPALLLRVSGDVTVSELLGPDAVTASGGCMAGAPMSLGFSSGGGFGPDWRYLAFDSAAPVTAGTSGPVPLQDIRWDNGTRRQANTGIAVPDRFSGSGSLTILNQTASPAHRMRGRITGELSNRAGQKVTLEAEFLAPISCP